jgi:hypothetical protein
LHLEEAAFLKLNFSTFAPGEKRIDKKQEKASAEEEEIAAAGVSLLPTTALDLQVPALPTPSLIPEKIPSSVEQTTATEVAAGSSAPRAVEIPKPNVAPTKLATAFPADSKEGSATNQNQTSPLPIKLDQAKTSNSPVPLPVGPAPNERIRSASPSTINSPEDLPRVAGTDAAKQQVTMSFAELQTKPKSSQLNTAALPAATDDAKPPLGKTPPSRDFSSGNQEGNLSGAPDPKGTESAVPPTIHFSTADVRPAESIQQTPRAEPIVRIFNELTEATTSLRTDGRANVEMQINLKDGEVLTVHLQVHGGEVRTFFKTDSTEMREAIARGWSDFSTSSAERGLRVTTPVFQSPTTQSGLNNFTNQRDNRREPAYENSAGHPTVPLKHPAKPSPSRTSSPLVTPATRGAGWAAWA